MAPTLAKSSESMLLKNNISMVHVHCICLFPFQEIEIEGTAFLFFVSWHTLKYIFFKYFKNMFIYTV